MKFRNLTPRTNPTPESAQDWTFGHGRQDYVQGVSAIALDIETALKVFNGECFWATNFGVDWWSLLGGSGKENIMATIITQARQLILGVDGVTAVQEISANVDSQRKLTIHYTVVTIYSVYTNFTIV